MFIVTVKWNVRASAMGATWVARWIFVLTSQKNAFAVGIGRCFSADKATVVLSWPLALMPMLRMYGGISPLRVVFFIQLRDSVGHAVAQLVEALRCKPECRGFDSRWCHWNFSLTWSFRPHYGSGVDSASNRNEYQEYFLGVKADGAQGWQPYHLHVPIVLKSGSPNLLEPSGPVQAANGITKLSRTLCLYPINLPLPLNLFA